METLADGFSRVSANKSTETAAVLYRALLNREPDPAGLAAHAARLTRGLDPHALATDFMLSQEFRALQRQSGRELIALTDHRLYAGYEPADLAVFDKFSHVRPKPQPGFLTEFIGSKASMSVLWDACRAFDGTVLPLPIPDDGYRAGVLEWIGMLKAVLAAKGQFAAMELGAGHGPWLAASAAAAKVVGINQLTLCGVEADPGRFDLLQRNLADNGLSEHNLMLTRGAVGLAEEVVYWPKIADPRNNAGATLASASTDATIPIDVVPLSRLLASHPLWDFLHMDVQGAEAEICAGCIGLLSEKVRYMVIGTHTRKLDAEVMDIMFNGGWSLEHEQPTRMRCRNVASPPSSLRSLSAGDGTQVWRNPRR